MLQRSELGEPHLEAKALRLSGDILWKLRREKEGANNYLRCISVVSRAQELQEAAPGGRYVKYQLFVVSRSGTTPVASRLNTPHVHVQLKTRLYL